MFQLRRANTRYRADQDARSVEFLDFLKKIDSVVPADLDIHLVLDNYGTHKTAMNHRIAASSS